MTRPENKYTNCALRGMRCVCSRGVVVWKHCPGFRPSVKAMEGRKR